MGSCQQYKQRKDSIISIILLSTFRKASYIDELSQHETSRYRGNLQAYFHRANCLIYVEMFDRLTNLQSISYPFLVSHIRWLYPRAWRSCLWLMYQSRSTRSNRIDLCDMHPPAWLIYAILDFWVIGSCNRQSSHSRVRERILTKSEEVVLSVSTFLSYFFGINFAQDLQGNIGASVKRWFY